jgi:type II secretory pathway pseudopilin PulG
MEYLAIALVLIFVLYLIDKHNRWRQVFKLTVGLVVLGIVGVGGLFGWQRYEAWREARQEARQEAEQEAEQAKQAAQKQVELAKTCKDWEAKHPIGSPLDKPIDFSAYGGIRDEVQPPPGFVPPDGSQDIVKILQNGKPVEVLGPPQGCAGPLEADYDTRLNATRWKIVAPAKPKPASKGQFTVSDLDQSAATPPVTITPDVKPTAQPAPNCEAVACSGSAVVM